MRRCVVAVLGLVLAMMPASVALGQTGASEDRVSLPEGPGSLEGVGENVEIDPNMGMMRYKVGISVPKGFAGVTPNLALSYSSGGGNSVVGMGWSIDMPCIERMTYRSLPKYTPEDDFAMGGGDQLVRLPGTNPPVYRSRYEKGFVRYTWFGAQDGTEGYWQAEYPDGSKAFFGADARGNVVPEARVGDPALGTFKYMMVEKVDVYGHSLRYTYAKFGDYALMTRIGYVFTDGDTPTYEVVFEYEDREDAGGVDHLSDAAPGFNLLLTQRLAHVDVLSRGQSIRSYSLAYEPYATSGGFTRLTDIALFGSGGEPHPTAFGFAYSKTLAGVCDGDGCARPFVMDMGALGVNIQAGQTTLLDINGDGLPDVLDTTQDGAHRFFVNVANADGTSAFEATPRLSAVGTRASHNLSAPATQVLDLNGDGFTDLINAATGQALINRGQGDWASDAVTDGTDALADALTSDFDAEDGDFQTLKFIDYDNDKRIDVMRSTLDTTTVFRNTGAQGFVVDESVEPIGAGFAEDGLQFADMNGDGLLDVVRLRPQTLLYKLNHGWGRWGDWVTVEDLPISASDIDAEAVELEDMNGDGLADLVVVRASRVDFSLNTNTRAFTAVTSLTTADVEGELPQRDASTTVLFADMNANGSSDIVWITSAGVVRALELFPVRPNLMSQVTNNLGQVTDVSYSTGAVQMALDGGREAWRYTLPFPMLVVTRMDQYDRHSNLHEVTEYRYHDGYYDGDEKQFRGFERSEVIGEGDAFHEDGLVELRFDVGAEDVYRNGLKLSQTTWSDGRELEVQEIVYGDCPVAEVSDGTEFPVRHVCATATRTIHKEGLDASAWVVKETRSDYDGYGNEVLAENLGVTSIGGGGCAPCDRPDGTFGAPCGAQCLGDEQFTTTDYVQPGADTGGLWMLSKPWRERVYGDLGSDHFSETRTYYDGAPFVGLAPGTLTQGNVSRVTAKIEADSDLVLTPKRQRFDAHGNVIELLQANGDVDGDTFRTVYTMDAHGLRVTRLEELMVDRQNQPYRLRRDFTYEPLFDRLIASTRYMVVRSSQPQTAPDATRYLYDAFGRLSARVLPGDTEAMPTEAFEYDLGDPVSRIIARRRSQPGGTLDIEEIACFDGRGRQFQSLTKLTDGLWQADGFQIFDIRSSPLRVYQPYQTTTDACAMAPPEDVRFSTSRHDALGRAIEKTLPDGAIYGTPSIQRTRYEPLRVWTFDGDDTDPDSPHFDTPSVKHLDGTGRTVAIEHRLTRDGAPAVTRFHYDGLGHLIGYTDAQGNRKVQQVDLLGRVTAVDDPNAPGGLRLTEYDENGNVVRVEDERGIVTHTRFDGQNRPLETYDEDDREGTLIQWTYDTPATCPDNVCTLTAGLLAEVAYPGLDGERAVDRFGYDARDRLVYRGRELAGHVFEHHHTYDNIDRVIETASPDGQVFARSYDGDGRITAIDGILASTAYNTSSLLAEARYADGTAVTITYDDLLRPSTRTIARPNQPALAAWGYAYDRHNNLTHIDDLAETPFPRGGTFTYDAWSRLTQATLVPDTPQAETLTYTYDTIHNLTSRTSSHDASPAHIGPMTYGASGPNALDTAGELALTYDASGLMRTRGGATAMTWDYNARLTRVELPDGRVQRNTYGSDDARVTARVDGSTTLYVADDFIVRDGISDLYIVHGAKRIARIESDALSTTLLTDLAPEGQTPDGQISAADAYLASAAARGLDLNTGAPSGVEALLWSSVRRLLMETGPDDGITWLHHDHLGSSVLATANVQGEPAVVGERRFYPFGLEAERVGAVDPFGYTGKERDDATGLVYYGARYYDPGLGRWLSPDPAYLTSEAEAVTTKLGDATTAYTFVLNNPITHRDPNGNDTVTFVPHSSDDTVKRVAGEGALSPGTGALGRRHAKSAITTLRIVGHGNMGSAVGGHKPWQHHGPKSLVRLLTSEGLSPGDYSGMTISVLACNAGSYVSKVGSALGRKPTEPFVARFAMALHEAGYRGITVEGFSGFVSDTDGSGYREHKHGKGSGPTGPSKTRSDMSVSYSVTDTGISAPMGRGKHHMLSIAKSPGGTSKTTYMEGFKSGAKTAKPGRMARAKSGAKAAAKRVGRAMGVTK